MELKNTKDKIGHALQANCLRTGDGQSLGVGRRV